jgi:hypothetical protein
MKQKFLLPLITFFALTISSKAQISKGAIWLGGSIGYNQYKEDYEATPDNYKNSWLGITPAIGKVIKDNLVAGVGITYLKNNLENSGSIMKQKERQLGGVAFIRQYVPIISRLYIFGEVSAAFRSVKGNAEQLYYNSGYSIVKTKTKGWEGGLSVTPGISVAINKKLQLETGFNNLLNASYSKRKTSSDAAPLRVEKSSFSAGLSLENESQFYLGFRFLINNKG